MAQLWRVIASWKHNFAAPNLDMSLSCSRDFKWVPECLCRAAKDGAILVYLVLTILPVSEWPMWGLHHRGTKGVRRGVSGLNCLQGTVQISIFNLWKFQGDCLLLSHTADNQSWSIFCSLQWYPQGQTEPNLILGTLRERLFLSTFSAQMGLKIHMGA